MKREALTHTKMKRLCRRLGIPLWQGIGLLESLWHLTARETPQGDIGKLSNEHICLALDYAGDQEQLIEALIFSGWIDARSPGRLVVHDWPQHCEDGVHIRLARARKFFITGQAPKLSRLGGLERKLADQFYHNPITEQFLDTFPQQEPLLYQESTNPCAQNSDPCARRAHKMPIRARDLDLDLDQNTTEPSQPANVTPEVRTTRSPACSPAFYPETLRAIREAFPSTDDPFVMQLVESVNLKTEIDTPDLLTAEAVRECWKQDRKKQTSAGLFLQTVPQCVKTWINQGRDVPLLQFLEEEKRARNEN